MISKLLKNINLKGNFLSILFLTAVAIRFYFINHMLDIMPWSDMLCYDEYALEILTGQGYNSAWPPIYIYLLSGLYYFFGHNYWIVQVVQIFISSFNCLIAYFIGEEIFNKKTGIWACVISVLYLDYMFFAGVIMSETLFIFFLSSSVYLLVKGSKSRYAEYYYAAAAFGLTLSALTKSMLFGIMPGIVIWITVNHWKEGIRKVSRKVIIFCSVFIITMLPWKIMIYYVRGIDAAVVSYSGIGFYTAHNPKANGGYVSMYFEGSPIKRSMSWAEQNRVCWREGIKFIFHHPFHEMYLIILRFTKQWTFQTHFSYYTACYVNKIVQVFLPILTNAVLYPFCFLGMVFSFRKKETLLLSVIIGSFTGLFLFVFSGSTRHHLASIPFIIVLAAYGITIFPELFSKWKINALSCLEKKKIQIVVFIAIILYANLTYQLIVRFKPVMEWLRG